DRCCTPPAPRTARKKENASHHLAMAVHGRSYRHIGTRVMRKNTNTPHAATFATAAGSHNPYRDAPPHTPTTPHASQRFHQGSPRRVEWARDCANALWICGVCMQ